MKNQNFLTIILSTLIMMMYYYSCFINELLLKWLMIEISTIFMISILSMNISNKLPSIYYFSISTISTIMIMMILIYFYNNIMNESKIINYLIQSLLFLKIGVIPFSFWMIHCYNKMNWLQIFIMSTYMKFLPINLLIELTELNEFTIYILIFSNIFISFYTFKLKSFKEIICCSSINQSSFFIIMCFLSKELFFYYSSIYSMMFFLITNMFYYYELTSNQNMYWNKFNYKLYIITILIYSSLPPFTSIYIKWMFFFEFNSQYFYLNNLIFLMMIPMIIIVWNYFNFMKYKMNKKYFKKIFYIKSMKSYPIYLFLSFNMFMILIFNLY